LIKKISLNIGSFKNKLENWKLQKRNLRIGSFERKQTYLFQGRANTMVLRRPHKSIITNTTSINQMLKVWTSTVSL
jgi:hypothetical protein